MRGKQTHVPFFLMRKRTTIAIIIAIATTTAKTTSDTDKPITPAETVKRQRIDRF